MKSKTTRTYTFDEHDVCLLIERELFQRAGIAAPASDIHWGTTSNGGPVFSFTEAEVQEDAV